LAGWSAPLLAQDAAPSSARRHGRQPPFVAPPQPSGMIRSIAVRGNQRLEPATIISYSHLVPGQTYTAETLDQALKELYATELFSDVVISGADTGSIVITVQENPVINRIVLEGNRRLKDDKIAPEIQLKPREIFHSVEGPGRRRPDHRALQARGPVRRAGGAQDRSARPEPCRPHFRDFRGGGFQGPPDQHYR
jgi:hypothetical protein